LALHQQLIEAAHCRRKERSEGPVTDKGPGRHSPRDLHDNDPLLDGAFQQYRPQLGFNQDQFLWPESSQEPSYDRSNVKRMVTDRRQTATAPHSLLPAGRSRYGKKDIRAAAFSNRSNQFRSNIDLTQRRRDEPITLLRRVRRWQAKSQTLNRLTITK
jgi:hypothetical protein